MAETLLVGRQARILVIDDEDTVRNLFTDTLQKMGYGVETADNGSEGLRLVKRSIFDVVFVDLKMPGMDGADILRDIRAIKPELPVVIITGYPDSDIMARALTQGPFGVMKKPFGALDIIAAVNSLLPLDKIGETRKSSLDIKEMSRQSAGK